MATHRGRCVVGDHAPQSSAGTCFDPPGPSIHRGDRCRMDMRGQDLQYRLRAVLLRSGSISARPDLSRRSGRGRSRGRRLPMRTDECPAERHGVAKGREGVARGGRSPRPPFRTTSVHDNRPLPLRYSHRERLPKRSQAGRRASFRRAHPRASRPKGLGSGPASGRISTGTDARPEGLFWIGDWLAGRYRAASSSRHRGVYGPSA